MLRSRCALSTLSNLNAPIFRIKFVNKPLSFDFVQQNSSLHHGFIRLQSNFGAALNEIPRHPRFIMTEEALHDKHIAKVFVNAKAEPNLYTLPVTVTTIAGEVVHVLAVFQDTKPEGSAKGTVVTAHGAPGSHKDFKYVYPKLEEQDVRVIGINFPGCGYTEYDERLKNDNHERVQFVQQIIEKLGIDEKLIFIGHSRGSENCLKMAVNNLDICSGFISVNPIGIRAHKGGRPVFFFEFLALLWRLTWLRWFARPLLLFIYQNVAKFKISDPDVCGVAVNLMSGLDYSDAIPFIGRFNDHSKTNVQGVLLYGGNDFLIERSVSKEFFGLFEDSVEVTSPIHGADPNATTEAIAALKAGHKTIGVFCKKDGHFLQKDKADLIVESVLTMLKAN
uniref:AB hydrolase-1 domain-containing protein n=2 Tax=Panagrellus redivivus TaxID=6233 RepID=A0A7E4V3A0_PANRE